MFDDEDIFYLGSGLALYFAFIKTCIIVALFAFLTFSGPSIYYNLTSNGCSQSQNLVACANTILLNLSVANKLNNQDGLTIQSYLADATIIIMFFIFQIARKKLRNIDIVANGQLDATDYAIMCRLPHNSYT